MCVCHVEIMMIMMMINFVTRQVIPSKQLCDVRSLSRWKLHGLALINTHTLSDLVIYTLSGSQAK